MTVQEIKTAVITLQEGYGKAVITADITKTKEAGFTFQSEDGNISNGIVRYGGEVVARFSTPNAKSLSVNYIIEDEDVMAEVQARIATFCKSAREYTKTSTVTIENNED